MNTKLNTLLRISRSIALAACAACALANPQKAQAQGKPLDHDVYDSWQRVNDPKMSSDGATITWQVIPQEGDGTLFIRTTTGKGRKAKTLDLSIPRGTEATISPDNKWLFCRIVPQFTKKRSEKIKKLKGDKLAPDTLAVVNLATMQIEAKYAKMSSFATGAEACPYLAFRTKADTLLVLELAKAKIDTIPNVETYHFNRVGDHIAVAFKKVEKKGKTEARQAALVVFSHNADGSVKADTLAAGAQRYASINFADDASTLLYTATTDTVKSGNKQYSMSIAKLGSDARYNVSELVAQGTKVRGTNGWTLNENSSAYFSPDGQRIFVGIAPIRAPKDTSIHDFEHAQLDIWSWDALQTPPQQKLNVKKTLAKTYLAVMNLNAGKELIPLTTKFWESIQILGGGKSEWAVAYDVTDYTLSRDWDYNSFEDIALVNLNDGTRREVAKKVDVLSGSASPEGRYLYWFDGSDLNWYTYSLETGATVNLTAQTGVAFYDEDDDHPMSPTAYDRSPRWLEGDSAILISDRFDIWKFSPDATSAQNLTKGVGRRDHVRFRSVDFRSIRYTSNESKVGKRTGIPAKSDLYFTTFHDDDKRVGYGKVNLAKGKEPVYFVDTLLISNLVKAREADRFICMKGNFRHCNDLYTATSYDFQNGFTKLTAINPQMAQYRWGRVELFSWTAYDGTPLKGLVYIPDGVKDTDKLPVMVYFYEKNTQNMYGFSTPAPSRSIVNIPFYTSRGYLCFIPDIVYTVGHPGESAYNCICSGAEAVCEHYKFADKTRMAIQGQSWGGYQTAYLVTRTNMFAAAGSGAPVSNMTSAYGGIRWGSGMVRTGQYEHGQSRIGKTLWEKGGLELYLENSPVFHLDKCTTPLLIMHNDADGAVPWYQGIEMFSGMRRLGLPVWMLQYNREAHNLVERRNCKDLSVRLQQFFDHYLLGAPMPAWMKTGVPADVKDEYSGFEFAE